MRTWEYLVWEYFQKIWMGSTPMSTIFGRSRLSYFRNHINNRLESNFGMLKLNLESSATMRECLECIMRFQQRCQNEYEVKDLHEGTWVHAKYSPDLNLFLQISTPWAAETISNEHEFALSVEARRRYQFVEENNVCRISSSIDMHTISLTNWTCSCDFSVSIKLPCRHLLFYRSSCSLYPVIPIAAIHRRWRRNVRTTEVLPSVPTFNYSKTTQPATKAKLGSRDKYVAASRTLHRLVQEFTDLPQERFENEINCLEEYTSKLRFGEVSPAQNTFATVKVKPFDDISDNEAELESLLDLLEENPATTAIQKESQESGPLQNNPVIQLVNLANKPSKAAIIVAQITSGYAGNDIKHPFSKYNIVVTADSDNYDGKKTKHRVNINKKVGRGGRPKIDPKARARATASSRKTFNEKIAAAGDIATEDIVTVARKLSNRERALLQVSTAIETIETSTKKLKKIPKIGTDKSPILSSCITSILRIALVREALINIYDSNKVITLDDSSDCSVSVDQPSNRCIPPYVRFSGIGNYTFAQLNSMQEISTLRSSCRNGKMLAKWVQQQSFADIEFESILGSINHHHPYAQVIGFEGEFLYLSHVYRVAPGLWLSEPVFRALRKYGDSKERIPFFSQ